jgi:hypothetical protein
MVGVMQECGDSHPSLHIIMGLITNRASHQARLLDLVELLAVVSTSRRCNIFITVGINSEMFRILLVVCRCEPMGRSTSKRHEHVQCCVK